MADPSPGTTIGPFTIIEALPSGHGGMARVFVASVHTDVRDAQTSGLGTVEFLPERVALKISRVLPADRASFSEQAFYFEALNNEVETLKRLRHPSIVRLFPIPRGLPRNPYAARASELDGGPWFCAMEYLGGGSLEARLKAFGALPLADALEIGYQVGLALDHVHAKGMAHLDVKPDNVLFRYPLGFRHAARPDLLQPVLIDFGIAAKMQKAGPQAGSIAYMPPERIRIMRGELAPEHFGDQSKVDVYGLGVLLYCMLTDRRPYEGLPRDELTSAILKTRPTPPRKLNPAVPARVEEMVMAALEKEPEQRPRIEELITRLDEAMVARPPAPPRARAWQRLLLPTPLSGLLAVALFLCSLVSLLEFGMIIGNVSWGRTATPPAPTAALVATRTPGATHSPEPPTATPTLGPTPTVLPPTASPTPR